MKILYRNVIPRLEQLLYFTLWIGSATFGCFTVFHESLGYDTRSSSYFVRGWILGRWKDDSEFEWSFWTSMAKRLWVWYIVYIPISKITCLKWKPYIMPCYTFLLLQTVFGYQVIVMLMTHFAFMYIIGLTGSVILVWIASVFLLSLINMKSTLQYIHIFSGDDTDKYNLLLLLLSVKNLHYTSFSIELAWQQSSKKESVEKTQTRHSFIDMVYYCTYLPCFFTGPIITFDKFIQNHIEPVKYSIKYLFTELIRILFWAILYDAILHFFYVSAMQQNSSFMRSASLWPFAGIAYLVGQLFMVKYVVLYGFPSLYAKFDGFVPPPQPKCVSTIYFYSEMWKYFDNGLYTFIKRYIYVPLGGSRKGLFCQLFTSFLCFTFIYIWHGTEEYIFVWAYLNFIGITIESLGTRLFRLPKVQSTLSRYLSPAWICRLTGVICVPVYAFYMTAIFMFLSGKTEIGWNFAYRLIYEGFPVSTIILFFAFLGCVHSSNIIAEKKNLCNVKKDN